MTHSATYSYDSAGRLVQVADSAANSIVNGSYSWHADRTSGSSIAGPSMRFLNGSYTWHADGKLASYPGPGYTRALEYDEAGNLASISRNYGTHTQLAFEYRYGFDGKLRWKRDALAANSPEYWFPCGVACCAGELVTLRSTDSGGTWQTHRTFTRSGTGALFIGGEAQLSAFGTEIVGFDANGLTGTNITDATDLPRGPLSGQFGTTFGETNDEQMTTLSISTQINSSSTKSGFEYDFDYEPEVRGGQSRQSRRWCYKPVRHRVIFIYITIGGSAQRCNECYKHCLSDCFENYPHNNDGQMRCERECDNRLQRCRKGKGFPRPW